MIMWLINYDCPALPLMFQLPRHQVSAPKMMWRKSILLSVFPDKNTEIDEKLLFKTFQVLETSNIDYENHNIDSMGVSPTLFQQPNLISI